MVVVVMGASTNGLEDVHPRRGSRDLRTLDRSKEAGRAKTGCVRFDWSRGSAREGRVEVERRRMRVGLVDKCLVDRAFPSHDDLDGRVRFVTSVLQRKGRDQLSLRLLALKDAWDPPGECSRGSARIATTGPYPR